MDFFGYRLQLSYIPIPLIQSPITPEGTIHQFNLGFINMSAPDHGWSVDLSAIYADYNRTFAYDSNVNLTQWGLSIGLGQRQELSRFNQYFALTNSRRSMMGFRHVSGGREGSESDGNTINISTESTLIGAELDINHVNLGVGVGSFTSVSYDREESEGEGSEFSQVEFGIMVEIDASYAWDERHTSRRSLGSVTTGDVIIASLMQSIGVVKSGLMYLTLHQSNQELQDFGLLSTTERDPSMYGLNWLLALTSLTGIMDRGEIHRTSLNMPRRLRWLAPTIELVGGLGLLFADSDSSRAEAIAMIGNSGGIWLTQGLRNRPRTTFLLRTLLPAAAFIGGAAATRSDPENGAAHIAAVASHTLAGAATSSTGDDNDVSYSYIWRHRWGGDSDGNLGAILIRRRMEDSHLYGDLLLTIPQLGGGEDVGNSAVGAGAGLVWQSNNDSSVHASFSGGLSLSNESGRFGNRYALDLQGMGGIVISASDNIDILLSALVGLGYEISSGNMRFDLGIGFGLRFDQ